MLTLKRTDSNDPDFQRLVQLLDAELAVRDGAEHAFYAPFNKITLLQTVVVAYELTEPVGCGAIRAYQDGVMEVKRMFVPEAKRGHGIASEILRELEGWAAALGAQKCILETGKKQPEAIALYEKRGYDKIANYGQYQSVENSVCFAKTLSN